MADNPYVPILRRNLPRLLALYNTDRTDVLRGCGDRRYWAWKLMDFPNATFQGAALGLSRMVVAGQLPKEFDSARTIRRIVSMIEVLPMLMDRKGGLAEALPNEGSFCVTGLVLGDCVGALDVLRGRIAAQERQALLDMLAPMADFLMRQDEHHGLISNHLASTALGMARWANAASDAEALDRAALWIERIKAHASEEGWMREYGGADPGYQSWCSSALAQLSTEAPQLETDLLLERSFDFLEAFALPDGSFSNGCGARMTRFLFPGGAELCAGQVRSAARLAGFARKFAGRNTHVSLDAIDEPNLVPFFNDIALAATAFQTYSSVALPEPVSRDFPQAGLLVRANSGGAKVINVARGGWLAVSSAGAAVKVTSEPVARTPNGKLVRAANGRIVAQTQDEITIESDLVATERMLPSPAKFVILRLLSLTVFRSRRGGNLVKTLLAGLLLGTRGKPAGRVERRIDINSGRVSDRTLSDALTLVDNTEHFSPMHMASQGYWQISDDTAS